jgi:hypothetical protein
MDMVNSELINNIRENTKMSFNKKIFDFFMNEYLKQDMNAYSSKDGEALFDLIRINGENASNMNPKEYQELLLRLINKSIEYVNANGIKTNTQELTAKLLTGLKRREGRLTFDSEELFDKKMEGEKNIFFYIDVDGKDIISILNDIIDKMTDKDIAYDITIPTPDEIVKGHTDAITIAVSPESYMYIVEALENVSKENKEKVKDNDYARNNWFGVNTVLDGIPADVLIGKLFIQAMNEVLSEEGTKYPDLMVDGESIESLIKGSVNKDESRQHAYNEIIKLDSTIGDKIYNKILSLMNENGLNPDNMYVYNSINDKLDKLYGQHEEKEDIASEVVQDSEVKEVPLEEAVDAYAKSLNEDKFATAEMNKMDLNVEASEVEEVSKNLEPQTVEHVEYEPTVEIQPQTESETIVSDTMQIVGDEVKQMIKDENPDQSLLNEQQMLLSNTIVALTPDEKKSMAAAIDQAQVKLERENRYMGLLDGVEDWTFDSVVKDENGSDITLLDFLDKNNTLDKIPFNSEVTLLDSTTEDGLSVSGKKFISKYVLDSLKLNQTNPVSPGGLTLEEIMEKYIEKIEVPEIGIIYPEGLTAPVKKGSLLKRFFKGR